MPAIDEVLAARRAARASRGQGRTNVVAVFILIVSILFGVIAMAASQNPCPRFMASPPAHVLHVVPACAVTARGTQASEEVGGRLGESVEHDGGQDDEARQNQQNQDGPAACHAAGERLTPATLSHVEGETRQHAKDSRWDQDPSVLHGHCHERAAPEAEGDDSQRQETAER